jgi:hypothetical protein
MSIQQCTTQYEKKVTQERQRVQKQFEQSVQQCSQGDWWNPATWFCWFTTVVSLVWQTIVVDVVSLVEVVTCVNVEIAKGIQDLVKSIADSVGGLWDALVDVFTVYYLCWPEKDSAGQCAIVKKVVSIPRQSAYAFDIAAVPCRLDYSDSGKRRDYRLQDGVAEMLEGGQWNPVARAGISYDCLRAGEPVEEPKFDMIAANNDRVFAKVEGYDDYYFAALEPTYRHRLGEKSQDECSPCEKHDYEGCVPAFYIKLDPESNMTDSTMELLDPLRNVEIYDHPASEPYRLFKKLLERPITDLMVVRVKPRLWYRIDARPPSSKWNSANIAATVVEYGGPLAVVKFFVDGLLGGPFGLVKLIGDVLAFPKEIMNALKDFGDNARDFSLPAEYPSCHQVTYCARGLGGLLGTKQEWRAFSVAKVLDIGVGQAHRHEQYNLSQGGELQPKFMENPLFANAPLALIAYRFFLGMTADGEGYVDGTVHFYRLVEFGTSVDARNFDDECSGPPLDPRYQFGILWLDEQTWQAKRWRLLHPSDNKGMLFSLLDDFRARVDVPDDKVVHFKDFYDFDERRFWCPFRALCIDGQSRMAVSRFVILVTGSDKSTGRSELYSINFSWASSDRTWRWRTLPEECDPQTIGLRDDMTIHVKGTFGGQGGRWFQRYLPADNRHVPLFPPLALGDTPQKPASGYNHPWQFLPEETFARADQFPFFGVYSRKVDSRSQYYRLRITSEDDPTGKKWVDESNSLHVTAARFNWAVLEPSERPLNNMKFIEWPAVPAPPSKYECKAAFRIEERGPLGWIALHWDKRDDEIMRFRLLPREVELTSEGLSLTAVVESHRTVLSTPAAEEAGVNIIHASAGTQILLYFVSRQPEADLVENIWKIWIAALRPESPDEPVSIFEKVRHGNFKSDGAYRYVYDLTDSERLQFGGIFEEYCSPEGRRDFGTSIWFEDVVGHVVPPEKVVFETLG